MQATDTTPDTLGHYEGLVRSTAARYESVMAGAAMDFDDICQVLRISVWRAIESYDPAKATQDIERYVFMCVRNQGKDLVRRRMERLNRGPAAQDAVLIEDEAPLVNGNGAVRDAFELRYLCADEEQAFVTVLEEVPQVPNTLSTNERRVLKLLYQGYRQAEISPILELTPSQVKTAVKGIREKMADWCPEDTTTVARSAA